MKKIISIITVCLIIAGIVVAGVFLFKTSNVQSIEIVGDVQTIYFVGSTTDVNFNNAELKITYKNGSVKLKKLDKNLVEVANFSTSVENKGLMKISYKSKTLDVGYSVICRGMYYLSEKNEDIFNGSDVISNNSGLLIAGVDKNGNDNTTSTELIYFGENGVCDYYSRETSTSEWYADIGYYNDKFYYNIRSGISIEDLEKKYEGCGYGDFKKDLVEVTVNALAPIQERYNEIRNSEELLNILRDGAEKANAIAERTMKRVKDKFGLGF